MEKKWNLGLWARVSKILQWILVLTAFIVSSIFMAYSNDIIWMCLWCLSMVKLVDLTDE